MAAALTQSQWYERLKSWVPSWMFSQSENVEPIFQALAKILSEQGTEVDSLTAKTFIQTATAEWLETHGFERTVLRKSGELDVPYRVRIVNQSLVNKSNKVALKVIIDGLLTQGQCKILEDGQSGVFCSRSSFLSRDSWLFASIKDAFSVIVPSQTHTPYDFYARGAYAGRADFIGTEAGAFSIYQIIVLAINEAKAFGALYRIVESKNTTVF